MNYVIYLPKSGSYGYTTVYIMVCYATKIAHFLPCHKCIIAAESANIFISNCYRLNGVPKVLVSDKDPKVVFLAKLYGKI